VARHTTDEEHSGYDVYILTWVALLVLTAVTVTVAGMHLGRLSAVTAVLIAAIKASLVLYFFMHLKYENRLFRTMVYVTLATFVVFIGITYLDILFR
jgi:cytochrome c oxidase subunit 4